MCKEFGYAGAVCSIEESSGPQNLGVSLVYSTKSLKICGSKG